MEEMESAFRSLLDGCIMTVDFHSGRLIDGVEVRDFPAGLQRASTSTALSDRIDNTSMGIVK